MLLQVTSKWFTAGVELVGGRVVRPAHILGYMIGWDRERVERYCRIRHWHCQQVEGAACGVSPGDQEEKSSPGTPPWSGA